jgi:hypothetical protein
MGPQHAHIVKIIYNVQVILTEGKAQYNEALSPQ